MLSNPYTIEHPLFSFFFRFSFKWLVVGSKCGPDLWGLDSNILRSKTIIVVVDHKEETVNGTILILQTLKQNQCTTRIFLINIIQGSNCILRTKTTRDSHPSDRITNPLRKHQKENHVSVGCSLISTEVSDHNKNDVHFLLVQLTKAIYRRLTY